MLQNNEHLEFKKQDVIYAYSCHCFDEIKNNMLVCLRFVKINLYPDYVNLPIFSCFKLDFCVSDYIYYTVNPFPGFKTCSQIRDYWWTDETFTRARITSLGKDTSVTVIGDFIWYAITYKSNSSSSWTRKVHEATKIASSELWPLPKSYTRYSRKNAHVFNSGTMEMIGHLRMKVGWDK